MLIDYSCKRGHILDSTFTYVVVAVTALDVADIKSLLCTAIVVQD